MCFKSYIITSYAKVDFAGRNEWLPIDWSIASEHLSLLQLTKHVDDCIYALIILLVENAIDGASNYVLIFARASV